ncbi:type II toxin-antitoxin system HicB family antitoxin [Blastochloris sulfoviridis]
MSHFVMSHYLAIVEDTGPETAVGVWFPDLPGCFSGGDDVETALANAREALTLYSEALADAGRAMPAPRSVAALRADPAAAADIAGHLIALVPFEPAAYAAE